MKRQATSEVPSGLFVAVIGDLVGSRDLPDRAAIQERLRATLADLGDTFGKHVASRFLVTLGDEFQGLLHPSAPLDRIFWRYQRRMHEVAETRFGFGVGRLATPMRPEAIGMDGPCFHAARAALAQAHEERCRFAFQLADQPLLGDVMNVAGSLLDRVLASWTATQWETVTLLDELGTQEAVAEMRGVRRQSVGDVVQSSLGHECIAAWNGLAAVIGRYAAPLFERLSLDLRLAGGPGRFTPIAGLEPGSPLPATGKITFPNARSHVSLYSDRKKLVEFRVAEAAKEFVIEVESLGDFWLIANGKRYRGELVR